MMFEELMKNFKQETVFALMDNHHFRKNIFVLKKLSLRFYKQSIKNADIIIAPIGKYDISRYQGRVLDIREYLASFEDARVFLERSISGNYLMEPIG